MKYLKEIIIIAILILASYLSGIGCPIKYATGISCPGCGLSRACMSVLKLQFEEAFFYHPLVYLLPLIPLLFIFRKKIPSNIFKIMTYGLAVVFMITYIYRMKAGSEIVYVNMKEGFVYKVICAFLNNVSCILGKLIERVLSTIAHWRLVGKS